MRFLVDECLYVQLAEALQAFGHEALLVRGNYAAMSDSELLDMSFNSQSILVSEDRDFGDLVFRDGHRAFGVVLAKVSEFDASLAETSHHIAQRLNELEVRLVGQFTVLEPGRTRQRALPIVP